MNKRKLKRQLSLLQVVMLGTAGAIGAQIFVLTGHAAGMAGPASILALLIGGLLSYSIALNYSELASTFPETGGALTYVREAWGRTLLTFLVGSLDCLSSTFFAALSAVGFAYSLHVFFPFLTIVPVAISIVLIFVVLNIFGVGNIGNLQILMGGTLLLLLVTYIISGLALPGGFEWNIFLSGGHFFIHNGIWENFSSLLSTVALVYVAYIGFEVIADDAEEIKNPDRTIPHAILISLTLCMIFYPLITLVTLGTISWNELGGSDTALTDAAARFLPGLGPSILGLAGMIATITSLNTAMLSATREAFTMSRDGMWPRVLSRLGRFRTPYVSILIIGVIICAVAAIGLVDFLSYISSSGYLFVLFWSNLALIRLRKRYPKLRRPFKTPFFPLTVYLAMGTCFFIIIFTDWRALGFGIGLLAVLGLFYYFAPRVSHLYATRVRSIEHSKDRILVPVTSFNKGGQLVHLAAILAQASEDTNVCVFNVSNSIEEDTQVQKQDHRLALPLHAKNLPVQILQEAQRRNVPIYTKLRVASNISSGILDEIETGKNFKFVLTGWPGPQNRKGAFENPVKILLEKAQTNVLVLLPRNMGRIHNILIPIGGGLHSRLALRLAYEIADQENSHITALHTYPESMEGEEIEDQLLYLREVVVDELGFIPARLQTRVAPAGSVVTGILDEAKRQSYDLIVMGASEEYGSETRLFGSVDDWIVEHVKKCSVLLVRRHESVAIHWLRRHIKMMENEY